MHRGSSFERRASLNVSLLYENKDGLIPEGDGDGESRSASTAVSSNRFWTWSGRIWPARRWDSWPGRRGPMMRRCIWRSRRSPTIAANWTAAEEELVKATASARPGNPCDCFHRRNAGAHPGETRRCRRRDRALQGVRGRRAGARAAFEAACGTLWHAEGLHQRGDMDGAVCGHANLSGLAINMERWAITTSPRRTFPMRSEALEKGLEIDAYTFWARYRWAQLHEEQKDTKQATPYSMRRRCDTDSTGILKSISRLAKLYQAEGRTDGCRRGSSRPACEYSRQIQTCTVYTRRSAEGIDY